MNFFSKNLSFLIDLTDTKNSKLAQSVGIKANNISNYKNGVSEPSFDLLQKIISFFNVTADEMLYQDISSKILAEQPRNLIQADTGIDPVNPDNTAYDQSMLKMIRDLAEEIGRLKMQIAYMEKNTKAV